MTAPDLERVFTDEDRPDCVDECGKKAALSKGRLAYKGRCSKCYKADVGRRKAEKQGDGVRGAAGARPEAAAGGSGGDGVEDGQVRGPAPADEAGVEGDPVEVPPGAEEPEPVETEGGKPVVRGKRQGAIACGWCLDGNHVARDEEPGAEDENGMMRRGRPGTLGCAADQLFKTGPNQGQSKGLRCVCSEEGHTRGKWAAQ